MNKESGKHPTGQVRICLLVDGIRGYLAEVKSRRYSKVREVEKTPNVVSSKQFMDFL